MEPLRVGIVSLYFYPDMSGTSHVLTDLAVGLREMGHQVTVYTTRPSFGSRPRTPAFEVHRGVHIRRVLSTHFDNNSRLGRLVNMISYFCSVLWALLIRPPGGPLLIVSWPPFLPLAGHVLSILRGQRYAFLVHDIFPDSAVVLGYLRPGGLVTRLWNRVTRFSLRHATQVIGLSKEMNRLLLEKAGADSDPRRFHLVHNWVDEHFIRPIPKSENPFVKQHGLSDRFVALYSGSMGLSDDLETILAGAERFRDRDGVFVFIGGGSRMEDIRALAARRGLGNVLFLPYQPQEKIPFSLTCADVALVAVKKGIEGCSMPSKLYASLASGRPVVALAEHGLDVARIIEDSGGGRSAEPGDVEGLVRILDFYYRDRDACERDGRKGREYLEAHFSRARALREYYEILRLLA